MNYLIKNKLGSNTNILENKSLKLTEYNKNLVNTNRFTAEIFQFSADIIFTSNSAVETFFSKVLMYVCLLHGNKAI